MPQERYGGSNLATDVALFEVAIPTLPGVVVGRGVLNCELSAGRFEYSVVELARLQVNE